MTTAITVRPATPDDLPWLHEQARAFSAWFGEQTGTTRPLYEDGAHAEATFRMWMADHVVLIAERPDTGLLGLVAGLLVPHFMNPGIRTLCEILWWVPVEHRGSRAALLLLETFLAVGRERADWISFSLNRYTSVAGRSLGRRGFQPLEQTLLLEVPYDGPCTSTRDRHGVAGSRSDQAGPRRQEGRRESRAAGRR
jgi:hypothetical protein